MDKKDNTHKIVVAALIERNGKYFVAKRTDEAKILPGKWEFPGGKVEPGETESEAIEREILEELNTIVKAEKLVAKADLGNGMVRHLYKCSHQLGAYKTSVHADSTWLTVGEIRALDMLPADIELIDQISEDKRPTALHELVIGRSYMNEDVMRIFLVSGQGGMRKSNRANSLVLFALHNTGNPYEDRWGDDGIMHYTGMGLSGDQSIDYAQNKTLAESRTNGVGDPYYERQKDEAGNERQVVKFPLRLSRQ